MIFFPTSCYFSWLLLMSVFSEGPFLVYFLSILTHVWDKVATVNIGFGKFCSSFSFFNPCYTLPCRIIISVILSHFIHYIGILFRLWLILAANWKLSCKNFIKFGWQKIISLSTFFKIFYSMLLLHFSNFLGT